MKPETWLHIRCGRKLKYKIKFAKQKLQVSFLCFYKSFFINYTLFTCLIISNGRFRAFRCHKMLNSLRVSRSIEIAKNFLQSSLYELSQLYETIFLRSFQTQYVKRTFGFVEFFFSLLTHRRGTQNSSKAGVLDKCHKFLCHWTYDLCAQAWKLCWINYGIVHSF